MGGGIESRCVGRVYGADGAVQGTVRTVHVGKKGIRKTDKYFSSILREEQKEKI